MVEIETVTCLATRPRLSLVWLSLTLEAFQHYCRTCASLVEVVKVKVSRDMEAIYCKEKRHIMGQESSRGIDWF